MKIHVLTEGPHGAALTPHNKLADVELHFEAGDGLLAGLKLVGFAVWNVHRRGLTVSMPARRYIAGTESRSFAVLRPRDHVGEEQPLVEAVLAAYREHVAAQRKPAPEDDADYARVQCHGDSITGRPDKEKSCGLVTISHAQYTAQMARPDSPWGCPNCGSTASFDDAYWEERHLTPEERRA